ncbi:hypothetical protein PR048_027522 [Dryococelus australis]|uniref:ABC transmembrane type-1 domain-containing protein n=1 Tax=Dryococelus australis TaxID=614101 RepID=A0ABQ9GGR2_9NEOP|nr:hypothetical protein PR048_027522 [Dryococelus australis]
MSTKEAIQVYGSLIMLCVVLVTARSIILFTFCIRASVKLYNKMFEKILRAKMWFFNTNPSRRILNRFSDDLGSVDEQLAQAFLEVVQVC